MNIFYFIILMKKKIICLWFGCFFFGYKTLASENMQKKGKILDKVKFVMSLKNRRHILCYIFSAFYFDGSHSKNEYHYGLDEFFGYNTITSENLLKKMKILEIIFWKYQYRYTNIMRSLIFEQLTNKTI